MKNRFSFQQAGLLLGASAAAMAVHGYHPYVEDAEIYLPGIKKLLNPALYTQNSGFFASHAGMTIFPNLIAASVRITHLPFDWALLLWQFLCVFFLLLGCWKMGRMVFGNLLAAWGGVALVASLLTIPVAGTSLYIMDQYLNTRSLSAAAVLMMVACAGERRYVQAGGWGLFAAAVHPLMFVFGGSFAATHFVVRRLARREPAGPAGVTTMAQGAASLGSVVLPSGLLGLLPLPHFVMKIFPPLTPLYHEALQSRSYFFLSQWEWYEIVGLLAPFAILWWFGRIGRRRGLQELASLCRALNLWGLVFALASLLTIPAVFERFTLLQPMRYLLLTYVLMFAIAGGLLAEQFLRRRVWLWLVVFVPICGGMGYAQREVFPGTPHLELPGVASPNPWVQAFLWIRENTPVDAYFALNPKHMKIEGEDQHGFRALAERSMLADNVKDSGAVTMFPGLAQTWKEQTEAQAGWSHFGRADFERLKQRYGVDWVVLDDLSPSKPTASLPGTPQSITGMECPYRNARLAVCRID